MSYNRILICNFYRSYAWSRHSFWSGHYRIPTYLHTKKFVYHKTIKTSAYLSLFELSRWLEGFKSLPVSWSTSFIESEIFWPEIESTLTYIQKWQINTETLEIHSNDPPSRWDRKENEQDKRTWTCWPRDTTSVTLVTLPFCLKCDIWTRPSQRRRSPSICTKQPKFTVLDTLPE